MTQQRIEQLYPVTIAIIMILMDGSQAKEKTQHTLNKGA
jgi:hypothetical protein